MILHILPLSPTNFKQDRRIKFAQQKVPPAICRRHRIDHCLLFAVEQLGHIQLRDPEIADEQQAQQYRQDMVDNVHDIAA